MAFSNFLQSTFSHFGRSARKKEVISRILHAPEQHNTDMVNLHRYDPTNIGDYYCGVHHYFDRLTGKYLDIFDYKREDKEIRDHWFEKITQNSLIIGGGGLLNREGFDLQMKLFEQLGDKGKKTVLWGLGHNAKSPSTYGKISKYNVDTSKFGLVGVRDYGMKEDWVPCASCLHPIFDKTWETENEIGVIFHKKTLGNEKVQKQFADFPSTANNAIFEDVVRFIGQTDTIITDSYHAMYWSLMLGKKVLVIPNSSKFYDFKYQPVISSFDNWQADIKKVQAYSGVLEDCRQTNLTFAEKAFDYLNV